MSPTVLITRRLPASATALLREVADIEVAEQGLAADALVERARGKDGLVCMLTDRVDAALLDAAGPTLRIVANVAVGYDNIDVPAARERGVTVTNTPDVLTPAVAEFTWALILAVTHRLAEGERLVRSGGWRGWAFDLLLGSELTGKQLGIVGAGRIGRAVAAKAATFGMRVAFAERRERTRPPDQPSRAVGRNAVARTDVFMPLDELLATSDVVSLHVPLRPATRHLINRTALARMKRSAYLVNTARGAVIDEEALVWALGERLIAGAALDVYENEPRVHPGLLALDNVVLTPHLGSSTTETRTVMAELAARNVAAVLSGQAPLTPV